MKLTQTQRMLLIAADRREDGRLSAPARALTAKRRDGALSGLHDAGLTAKLVADAARSLPNDDFAYVITSAGRDLLAAEQVGISLSSLGATEAPEDVPVDKAVRSKIAQMLTLLRRGQGATLQEIGQITDWLPHSVRAALTSLRKKGHAIDRRRRDDVAVYYLKQEG